jgi:hypothetical protein
MSILFRLSEDATEDGLNSKSCENAGIESRAIDFFMSGSAGEFIALGGVASHRGEGP